ncbi:MAG: CDP-diacylglycerol--serine O-phosphatidyltransferase [Deltaproteobacteria bacterium]|nr:CDP-diacylglycerol--serine O-phosphatidyltransferase [Deltaproteobacteria bacterium]
MKRNKRAKTRDARRGIYILPNLFTSANLFCGFYAIIAAIQGGFVKSAIAIMIAAVFDNLDGKVARATHTESKFGVEYDSLADAISFGVAPGIVAYLWALKPFGRLGWLAAFLFVACGVLRLARFNTQKDTVSSEYFVGLPIPAAACMIATMILFINRVGVLSADRNITILILIYVLSFLMVSTLKYNSFKKSAIFRKKNFNALVTVVLVFSVIAYEPSVTFFFIGLTYIASGPVAALFGWRKTATKPEPEKPSEGHL